MFKKLKNLFTKPKDTPKSASEILHQAWKDAAKAHDLLQRAVFYSSGVQGGDMSDLDKRYFHEADYSIEQLTNGLRIKYENQLGEESGRSYIRR